MVRPKARHALSLSRYLILVGPPLLCSGGCAEDRISDTFSESTGLPSAVAGQADVPAVTIDLPKKPRPWDNSDEALVEAAKAAGGVVAVAFKEPASPHALQTGRREGVTKGTVQAGTALVSRIGGEILYNYRFIGAVLARLEPSLAPILRASPLVDFVEPSQRVATPRPPTLPGRSARSAAPPKVAGAPSAEYADWGVWQMETRAAWSYTTGAGTKFMSILTGHEQGHIDLPLVPTNNCGGAYGGCDDGPYYYVGTHALGLVVERWNGLGWVGVAPGVLANDTYVWGACWPTPEYIVCDHSSAAAALDAARMVGVKVVFIGLYYLMYDAIIANAVANAWQYGDIFMVAPAGDRTSSDSAAGQPWYPAAHDHVLGVSGINPDSSFAQAPGTCGNWGSQYGPHVDVAAAFYTTSTSGGNSYISYCSTGTAASLVAGVAALMRAHRPGDDADAIARGLKASAAPLGDPRYFGAGFVNALKAVRDSPPPPSPLSVSISGPRSVRPAVYCAWSASVSGGHPPYRYAWYRGYLVGTESWVELYTDTNSFYLTLEVTDAWNDRGSQQIWVTNTPSARACLS